MEISNYISPQYQGEAGDVVSGDESLNQLETEDFMNLLITELTQQDPFEPMENQDLLNQVSTIKSMEESTKLNTTLETLAAQTENTAATNLLLTQTLEAMAMQSNMATGAGLIGKEVTAQVLPDDVDADTVTNTDMIEVRGTVTGVRLVDGEVMLQLDTDMEISMADVSYVGDPSVAVAAAETETDSDESADSTDSTEEADATATA